MFSQIKICFTRGRLHQKMAKICLSQIKSSAFKILSYVGPSVYYTHLPSNSNCCLFSVSFGFLFVENIQKKLQKECEMFLGQMCCSTFDALEESIDLLTHFSVYSLQSTNPTRFETNSTLVAYCMKKVMPEPCILK